MTVRDVSSLLSQPSGAGGEDKIPRAGRTTTKDNNNKHKEEQEIEHNYMKVISTGIRTAVYGADVVSVMSVSLSSLSQPSGAGGEGPRKAPKCREVSTNKQDWRQVEPTSTERHHKREHH